jgi:shikimate kinase
MRKLSAARPKAAPSAPTVIFLVGFMGAGKTSVGRHLGEYLDWEFEDLDDRIERNLGRTVSGIFSSLGEPSFRRAEAAALKQVLKEIKHGGSRVIALGGGAFIQSANAAALKAAKVPTVFLDAAAEELWERCEKQARQRGANRPLLSSQQRFSALHKSRCKGYLEASIRIDTGGKKVEAISIEIAQALGLKP